MGKRNQICSSEMPCLFPKQEQVKIVRCFSAALSIIHLGTVLFLSVMFLWFVLVWFGFNEKNGYAVLKSSHFLGHRSSKMTLVCCDEWGWFRH